MVFQTRFKLYPKALLQSLKEVVLRVVSLIAPEPPTTVPGLAKDMARPSMAPPINPFEQLQQSLRAEFETSLKNRTELLKAE